MKIIEFILLVVIAYLMGSIPTAYLVAKWTRGIDIRQYGSGNVGASNVLTTVSKRWAVPVSIFDMVKGAVMVLIARLLGLEIYQEVAIGLAAVAGHNWPVFLHFEGGRGILTSLGVVLVLSPKLGLVALAIAFVFAPFHLMAFGVTLAVLLLPVFSWFLAGPFSIVQRLPLTLGYTAIFIIMLFRRLTAPKSEFASRVSRSKLIINRILFDRDIRDRKAWISRTPTNTR